MPHLGGHLPPAHDLAVGVDHLVLLPLGHVERLGGALRPLDRMPTLRGELALPPHLDRLDVTGDGGRLPPAAALDSHQRLERCKRLAAGLSSTAQRLVRDLNDVSAA